MNQSFFSILSASDNDRHDLFLATANRLGVPIQNIEKDFWVCWILDLLFNDRGANEPRLLFKGGTSLSKAYSLISRFSEDIDITIFREDIHQNMALEEVKNLSGKQQRKYCNQIQAASQQYVCNLLKVRLEDKINSIFNEFGIADKTPKIQIDPSDNSGQTILIYYTPISTTELSYIMPAVKIEAGARSALDPHTLTTISPYIAHEMKGLDLNVKHVVTINAERTFWDKIIILHGIRRWYDLKGVLRQNGHRFSRHYYDVYQFSLSNIGQIAKSRLDLAIDCSRHAQAFFNSSALDLQNALPGSFSLMPNHEMIQTLKRDYQAMSGMIFGDIPEFNLIIDSLYELEKELNS